MVDISTVRTDLLSIVGNKRMPIKNKRILIKRGLKAIITFIDLKPNKIYNLKKKKINKILSLLPSIKYNEDLKKLLTQKLITELTDFEKYQDIISSSEQKEDDIKETNFENCIKKIYLLNNTDKSNYMEAIKNALPNKEILISNAPVKLEDSEVESVESKKTNESLNSDTDEDSVCDEDSDTEENSDTEEDTDGEDSNESDIDSNSDTEELDGTVNNLVEDLSDGAKAKLIIKLTKYKLEHVLKMEAEKNRNMERMEELAIKKLKINNKYKLKKLENRK